MNALERAARELLALAAAGQEIDLSALEAALEPDPTPIYAFSEEDPSWVIQAGQEGTAGLKVIFTKEAVGLLPIGFPGGFSLSWPAAYLLRDLLVEELEAAGTWTALAGEEEGSCFDSTDYWGQEYEPTPDLETEQACDVEAANAAEEEVSFTAPAPQPAEVVDLMAALKASLAAAKKST